MFPVASFRTNTFFLSLPIFCWVVLACWSLPLGAHAAGMSTAQIIALTNADREKIGLGPLSESERLSGAALAKGKDMAKRGYFAHTSPTGQSPWYWIKQAGYQYKSAGENLAMYYSNAEDQETAWMKSKTHRENILNPKYREIGVAVVQEKMKGKTTFITVVYFGNPSGVMSEPVPVAPQSKETPKILGFETHPAVVSDMSVPLSPLVLSEVQPAFPPSSDLADAFSSAVLVLLGGLLLLGPLALLTEVVHSLVLVLRDKRAKFPIHVRVIPA